MIKGALHIHSDISKDSNMSRMAIRDLFENAGYNFLMITEHAEDINEDVFESLKKEYNDLSTGNFLIIPGIEIKWKDKIHFLAFGAKKYMANESNLTIKEMIEAIRYKTQCEFLAWGHFGQPVFEKDFISALPFVDGLEVFNSNYHGIVSADFFGLRMLNRFYNINKPVALGGIDLHKEENFNKNICIIKELNTLKREAIFEYLKEGKAVFSSGRFILNQPKYSFAVMLFSFVVSLGRNIYKKTRLKLLKLKNF